VSRFRTKAQRVQGFDTILVLRALLCCRLMRFFTGSRNVAIHDFRARNQADPGPGVLVQAGAVVQGGVNSQHSIEKSTSLEPVGGVWFGRRKPCHVKKKILLFKIIK
jgi:hypothetical protein